MDVTQFIKKEPMPTIQISENGPGGPKTVDPIDNVPAVFSIKRRLVLDKLADLIGETALAPVPSLSGVLAGGPPATLTQIFNQETMTAGIYAGLNWGDQTPGGIFTLAMTVNDRAVVPATITNTCQWQIKEKTAELVKIIATSNDVICLPMCCMIGAANPLTLVWTGPAGVQISTELLTPKHPQFIKLINSDLYERLIRFELNRIK